MDDRNERGQPIPETTLPRLIEGLTGKPYAERKAERDRRWVEAMREALAKRKEQTK